MIKMTDLLDHIELNDYLEYFINNLYNRFMNKLRYSLSKLNSISTVDVNRLFKLANMRPEFFTDIFNQYPQGANTPRQPIYNLLLLISLKAYNDPNNKQLSIDTNSLFGLIVLGRLFYKWFKYGPAI